MVSAASPRNRLLRKIFWGLASLVCWLASLALLQAPALWNGYPLVFYDTGGYVEAALNRYLVPGRSLFYGLFLQLFSLDWRSFWGVTIVQAACTLWLIHLLWRTHRLRGGPLVLLPVTAVLALLTSISWYVGQLMPDIFIPLIVMALWLLSTYGQALRWWEQVGLSLIVLVGLFSHMSCLALALGLVAVLLAKRLFFHSRLVKLRVLLPTVLVLVPLLLMPPLHTLLTGQGGYTPGGTAFLFGRLVQDGLAKRWLTEHCPDPKVRLCAWRDDFPQTADTFLWEAESPYKKIGGWKDPRTQRELSYLVRAMVEEYPLPILWNALDLTLQQLGRVATGEDLEGKHWDTRGILSTFLPRIAAPLNRARQQHEEITPALLARWNRIHEPVALGAMALLLPIALWGIRSKRLPLAGFSLFVLCAVLGNAFICGALSNPHDRYQSRLIWLAVLVVLLALFESFGRRPPAAPGQLRSPHLPSSQ